jgi:hypothetical protein
MDNDAVESASARAPVLGTWRRWYALVLGTLAFLITLFSALSLYYK